MSHLLLLFFICALPVACNVAANPENPARADDIQILIDVSGSMKQTDPHNLRTDATQLLIHLLPEQSHASIWLFAEKTSLLSRSEAVDEAWRQQALKASKTIHSRGLYTDIEGAIKASLEAGFAGTDNKYLIILTDGVVDISRDIMVSADSRERILSEWLPKLQQQKIKVQTIGLSDQVDKELLEKLAFATGGWYETAKSSEQLQRLILKSIQKVAPKDSLPLNGNQFSVDSSVREFSLLVFKKPDAASTQLLGPDQNKLTKDTRTETLSWLATQGYDLITVKQPMPGDWHIEAALDPDNQVMILTDLKMHLGEVANFIAEKQDLPLKLHFTEQGQPISRPDFLNLVSIGIAIDQQATIPITTLNSESGFFTHTLKDLSKGKHTLSIIADGKTFKREITTRIEVVSSPITAQTQIDNTKRLVTIKFLPDTAVIDPETLMITATLHQDQQAPQTRTIKATDGEWLLNLASLPFGESILLNFTATAKSPDGQTVTPALAPITIDDSTFAPLEPLTQVKPSPEPPLPAQPAIPAETALEHSNTADPEAETHWGMVVGLVVAVNLLLCFSGFFIWRTIKKANQLKQQQLLEKLA